MAAGLPVSYWPGKLYNFDHDVVPRSAGAHRRPPRTLTTRTRTAAITYVAGLCQAARGARWRRCKTAAGVLHPTEPQQRADRPLVRHANSLGTFNLDFTASNPAAYFPSTYSYIIDPTTTKTPTPASTVRSTSGCATPSAWARRGGALALRAPLGSGDRPVGGGDRGHPGRPAGQPVRHRRAGSSRGSRENRYTGQSAWRLGRWRRLRWQRQRLRWGCGGGWYRSFGRRCGIGRDQGGSASAGGTGSGGGTGSRVGTGSSAGSAAGGSAKSSGRLGPGSAGQSGAPAASLQADAANSVPQSAPGSTPAANQALWWVIGGFILAAGATGIVGLTRREST